MTAKILEMPIPDIPEHGEKDSIELTKSRLKGMWDYGVINTDSYIALALLFDGETGDIVDVHIDNFVFRWRGEIPNKSGNLKELKPAQVEAAIVKMKAKRGVDVSTPTIQLCLNF